MALVRRCEKHECLYEHVCPHCDPEGAEKYNKEEHAFQVFKVIFGIICIISFIAFSYLEQYVWN